MSQASFFAVDRNVWESVCALGLNEAVSYVVIAAGTGRDHRKSSWLATAIEKYTGMHHIRAKAAIAKLIESEFLTCEAKGKLRRYELIISEEPQFIWLPTSIVEGAAGERPPLKLLRKSQDVLALKLFVDLYFFHDLYGSGGCEWRPGVGIRLPYERRKVGQYGAHALWSFTPDLLESGAPRFQTFRDAGFVVPDFYRAFDVLETAGLFEVVEHLIDSDTLTGEIIHPLPIGPAGEPGEHDITRSALAAGRRILSSWIPSAAGPITVPIEAIATNVQLIGVIRLRYRPDIRQTKAWVAASADWPIISAGFDDLASGIKGRNEASGIKVS